MADVLKHSDQPDEGQTLCKQRFILACGLSVGTLAAVFSVIFWRVELLEKIVPVFTVPISAVVGFYFAPRSPYSRLSANHIAAIEMKKLDDQIGKMIKGSSERLGRRSTGLELVIALIGMVVLILGFIVFPILATTSQSQLLPQLSDAAVKWTAAATTPFTATCGLVSFLLGIRYGKNDHAG